MIAHVAGVPVEELLLALLVGASALYAGVGAWLGHRRRALRAFSRSNKREDTR